MGSLGLAARIRELKFNPPDRFLLGAALISAPIMTVALLYLPPIATIAIAMTVPAAILLYPKIARSLLFGMALFVCSQPLTAFAINTPIASITVDNILLILLAALHIVARPFNGDKGSKVAAGFLFSWALTYLLRIAYLSPPEVARHLVTVFSFLLIFLLARRLPQTFRTVKVIGLAGFATISIFGIAAILVTAGLLPRPKVGLTFGRDILGFQSPFPRTYGLEVAIDAIAFLGPITVPLFAYWLVGPRINFRTRVAALLALSSLVTYILLFFQARGMLISMGLAVGVMFMITRRRARWLILPVLVWGAIEYAPGFYESLSKVDTVSSDLRFSNMGILLGMVREAPWQFVLGQNEGEVFYLIAVQLGLAQAIGGQGDDAIHNAFLSQLVGGGWLAFVAFTVPFVMMLTRAFRNLRREPESPLWAVLFVAAVLVIFEMNLETARAQVIGNWIVLGLIFASQINRPVEGRHDL